jgi:hypothetical protein
VVLERVHEAEDHEQHECDRDEGKAREGRGDPPARGASIRLPRAHGVRFLI